MTVKSGNREEKKLLTSTEEIRAALAKRIIRFIGKTEDQTTAIPGFAIYRRDHPTGPIFGLYEPSLTLLVQGRKRVMLGKEAFACGPSRYLLTSVNVPVIGQVVEARCLYPPSPISRHDLDESVAVSKAIAITRGPSAHAD